jgi:hypothetical protein
MGGALKDQLHGNGTCMAAFCAAFLGYGLFVNGAQLSTIKKARIMWMRLFASFYQTYYFRGSLVRKNRPALALNF